MQINAINNTNLNQNSINQTQIIKNPSFKMVFPVKVYVDNVEVNNRKIVKKGINTFRNIMTEPTNGDERLLHLKLTFKKYVPDFHFDICKCKKFQNLRCFMEKTFPVPYFLTGNQAQELDKLGHDKGRTIKRCKEAVKKGEITQEAADEFIEQKGADYINQVKKFVRNRSIRLKDSENNELGLCIFMKSAKNDKKEADLSFDTFKFRKNC